MLKRLIDALSLRATRFYHRTYYRKFAHVGERVRLGRGVKIDYPEGVSLGDDVCINDFTWISLSEFTYQKGGPPKKLTPRLSIGAGTYIGRFGFIACFSSIDIGERVMFSDRCYIGDSSHGYHVKDLPIIDQYLFSPGPIRIGDGCWCGINVSIMPNVTIGKQCILGANSVVTSDIPDYHIATGVPAKIIRRMEFK